MSLIEEKLSPIISDFLKENHYELYELSFISKGKDSRLSVVVDRKKVPIDLEEIVNLSERLASLLDEHDVIDTSYTLDVSSAGAEKRINIEELDEYQNEYVNLHLTNPYDGENYVQGTIVHIDKEFVEIEDFVKTRKRTRKIVRSNIDKANLAIKF
ncbi:MAG: hypothetical protein LKF69_00370 [Bacilli bacterium]|jgi:ribosome maturation factor RimP|nr:hypothetical protein [Bacilli bacterium]MCH4202419.1 hypothetical protein [Bacilli bacterium]MCH4235241.1 hypothetical protein [Bacilli bacterium]